MKLQDKKNSVKKTAKKEVKAKKVVTVKKGRVVKKATASSGVKKSGVVKKATLSPKVKKSSITKKTSTSIKKSTTKKTTAVKKSSVLPKVKKSVGVKKITSAVDSRVREIQMENLLKANSRVNTKADDDVTKFAKIACKVLEDKKLEDIILLELDKSSGLADYFIIATASSSTQMKAALDSVYRELKNNGVTPHFENQNADNSVWFLLDYGFMVVHLFSKEGRAYYDLDKLYNNAKKIDLLPN